MVEVSWRLFGNQAWNAHLLIPYSQVVIPNVQQRFNDESQENMTGAEDQPRAELATALSV
jgi:hypothetical protein